MDDRQPVRRVEVLTDQVDPARREPLVLLVAAGATAGEIGAAAYRAHDVDQQFGGAAVDVEL